MATKPANNLQTQVNSLVESIHVRDIENEDEYQVSGEILRQVKTLKDRIINHHKPIKEATKDAYDSVVVAEKSLLTPLDYIRAKIEGVRAGYRARIKALQQAEQSRLQQVLQNTATEQAVQRAATLIEQGKESEAREIVDRLGRGEIKPISEVPIIIKTPKSEGVGTRTLKRFRVVDINKVDLRFLIINKTKVNQVIRIHGKKAEEIVGGIEYYEEEREIVRGLD
jgi:hypothetical protein